jgi:DNA replication protein DnaC
MKQSPPQAVTCKYCGKTLEHKGFILGDEVFMWSPNPERCECEKAKAFWEEHDRKEAEKKAAEEEAKRNREMQERINRLLLNSGIKKRFRERTFDRFKTDTAERKRSYQIAKEYADNFKAHKENGSGLYIEGTNGTGKTHLAAAIALQLISEGIPVICKTSSDLLLDIKRSFDDENVQEWRVLDVYRKADLLIVDDLGKEQCSDWAMTTLYTIFNDRYEDMKPVIITTNYNTDALATALTPNGKDDTKIVAIISRLKEVSTVITMAWDDARETGI